MENKKGFLYLVIGTIIFFVILIILFAICQKNPTDLSSEASSNSSLELSELNFDWGEIPIKGGKVLHNFKLGNSGSEILRINSIETSCMCTTARLITDQGEEGPSFSMAHQAGRQDSWVGEISPGEEAELTVIFDPLFHGPDGLGPITRTITFQTNDIDNKTVELRLDGNVI